MQSSRAFQRNSEDFQRNWRVNINMRGTQKLWLQETLEILSLNNIYTSCKSVHLRCLLGVFQKDVKLDELIADNIRIWRPSVLVVMQDVREHVIPVLFREIHLPQFDIQNLIQLKRCYGLPSNGMKLINKLQEELALVDLVILR